MMRKKIRNLFLLFIFLYTPKAFGFSIAVAPYVAVPPFVSSAYGLRLSIFSGYHENMYGLDLGLIGNITTKTHAGTSISTIYNYSREQIVGGLQFAGVTNVVYKSLHGFGLQLSGANVVLGKGDFIGWQLGFIGNTAHKVNIAGFQLGTLFNTAKNFWGFQFGMIGFAKNLGGVQFALVPLTAKTMGGIQIAGLFGYAKDIRGAQLGLIPYSPDVKGIQFGIFPVAGKFTGIQYGVLSFIGKGGGFQAGLVNMAGDFGGLQVGLINFATKLSGIQIGLINIAGNALIPVLPVFNAAL